MITMVCQFGRQRQHFSRSGDRARRAPPQCSAATPLPGGTPAAQAGRAAAADGHRDPPARPWLPLPAGQRGALGCPPIPSSVLNITCARCSKTARNGLMGGSNPTKSCPFSLFYLLYCFKPTGRVAKASRVQRTREGIIGTGPLVPGMPLAPIGLSAGPVPGRETSDNQRSAPALLGRLLQQPFIDTDGPHAQLQSLRVSALCLAAGAAFERFVPGCCRRSV